MLLSTRFSLSSLEMPSYKASSLFVLFMLPQKSDLTHTHTQNTKPKQTKNPVENSSWGNTVLLLVTDILQKKKKKKRQNKSERFKKEVKYYYRDIVLFSIYWVLALCLALLERWYRITTLHKYKLKAESLLIWLRTRGCVYTSVKEVYACEYAYVCVYMCECINMHIYNLYWCIIGDQQIAILKNTAW